MEFLLDTYQYFAENQLELYGLIFGIACVYLNLKENIWAWPTGIVSVALFCFIFWQAKLYGDFGLHIIYVVLGFYGWYNWLYGGAKSNALAINKSTKVELAILGIVGLFATGILGYFLSKTDAAYPYWDATTTVFSLIAQYQLTQKRIENWLVWVGVDVLCIGIYFAKGLHITTALYVAYLLLATAGWFNWKKLYREQEKRPENPKNNTNN